jgi:hypothetical protein
MAGKQARSRGNTYVLTPKGVKHMESVTGQARLMANALRKSGPLTSAQLLAKVGKSFKSKSAADNLAFHLCVWRREGFIKFGPKPKA